MKEILKIIYSNYRIIIVQFYLHEYIKIVTPRLNQVQKYD